MRSDRLVPQGSLRRRLEPRTATSSFGRASAIHAKHQGGPLSQQLDRSSGNGHGCLAFEPWFAPAHQDTTDLKRRPILSIPQMTTSRFKTVLSIIRAPFSYGTSSGLVGSNSSIMMTRFRKTAVFFLLDARMLDIGPDLP
jgi:hypothetical protein